jgi:hypothetical protein
VVFTAAPEPLPFTQPVAPVMPPERKRIPWWGWTLIVIGVLIVLGNLGGGADNALPTAALPPASAPATPQPVPAAPTPKATVPAAPVEQYDTLDGSTGLALLPGWKSTRDQFGNLTVKGKIKNTNHRKYGYAQVQFKVRDKDGSVTGTALANAVATGCGATDAIAVDTASANAESAVSSSSARAIG